MLLSILEIFGGSLLMQLMKGIWIFTSASSPRNSCISVRLERSDSLLGLVDWVHHVLVYLTIQEYMRSILVIEYFTSVLLVLLHVVSILKLA